MSANPHATVGLLKKDLRLPDFRFYAQKVENLERAKRKNAAAGRFSARRNEAEHEELPRLRPR